MAQLPPFVRRFRIAILFPRRRKRKSLPKFKSSPTDGSISCWISRPWRSDFTILPLTSSIVNARRYRLSYSAETLRAVINSCHRDDLSRPHSLFYLKVPSLDARVYRQTGLVEAMEIVGEVGGLKKECRKRTEVALYCRVPRPYYPRRFEFVAYTLPYLRTSRA